MINLSFLTSKNNLTYEYVWSSIVSGGLLDYAIMSVISDESLTIIDKALDKGIQSSIINWNDSERAEFILQTFLNETKTDILIVEDFNYSLSPDIYKEVEVLCLHHKAIYEDNNVILTNLPWKKIMELDEIGNTVCKMNKDFPEILSFNMIDIEEKDTEKSVRERLEQTSSLLLLKVLRKIQLERSSND